MALEKPVLEAADARRSADLVLSGTLLESYNR